MGTIQFQSRVGQDGVLAFRVPLGQADANAEVTVTIAPAGSNGNATPPADWHEFVEQTYGSCADLGLEEPADLPLQQRDWTR